MPLCENTEKDAEDFSCCGDSTADQWIERGNGIEYERLPNSRAHRELDDSIGRLRGGKSRTTNERGSISFNFQCSLPMKIRMMQVVHREQ